MRPSRPPGRRNPPRRVRLPAWPRGAPKTPGRLLFEMVMADAARPAGPGAMARRMRLITEAARTLAAEAKAGMWSDER